MLTGGSTGSPTRVYWKLKGHLESLRDQYWARTWWGVAPFDRQAMLWGHSHSFGTGLKGYYHRMAVPVIDGLRGRRRFSAYRMDAETLRKYYDSMARFRPRSLYAYASAAHLFASANRGRPPLSQPLAAAFLAAEPVQQSYRSSIRDVFGCPAVGEYGSIECGMIAYEHPSGGYRVFERSVLVETEKNQNGFQILVTQLRDTGFPLFRYEIGDETPAAVQVSEDGFETLHAIRGRSHDFLWTPLGSAFHAEMITPVIERFPEVVLFNVHQDQERAAFPCPNVLMTRNSRQPPKTGLDSQSRICSTSNWTLPYTLCLHWNAPCQGNIVGSPLRSHGVRSETLPLPGSQISPMRILMIHNEYGALSGEESMVGRISGLLRDHGHAVDCWFEEGMPSRAGIRIKARAFIRGIYSPIAPERPDSGSPAFGRTSSRCKTSTRCSLHRSFPPSGR